MGSFDRLYPCTAFWFRYVFLCFEACCFMGNPTHQIPEPNSSRFRSGEPLIFQPGPKSMLSKVLASQVQSTFEGPQLEMEGESKKMIGDLFCRVFHRLQHGVFVFGTSAQHTTKIGAGCHKNSKKARSYETVPHKQLRRSVCGTKSPLSIVYCRHLWTCQRLTICRNRFPLKKTTCTNNCM